jgi:hypothetical protein
MLHPDIRNALARQKHADWIAAADASRAAALAQRNKRVRLNRLVRLMQATILRRWSQRQRDAVRRDADGVRRALRDAA